MSVQVFTQRFYLDTPAKKGLNRGGNNYVGEFRSFWVSKTNKSSFDCNLILNVGTDREGNIPLRLNQCQSFKRGVESACIEFDTAQAGVWVDITFSTEDDLSVGSVAIDLSGEVTVIEGKSHVSARVDLPDVTITEILPADDTRAVSRLQCKSGGVFWIGNPTAAELLNGDYKNICQKIILSIDEVLEWKNKAALNAYTDAGASVFSLVTEKVTV